MNGESTEAFSGLDRAFHEPKRLAILSSLAARGTGPAAFTDLKEECGLTDGNLNRHLKVLEEARVVRVVKVEQKGRRSRTEVRLTATGRRHFLAYLDSLERALEAAARSVGRPHRAAEAPGAGAPRPAPER